MARQLHEGLVLHVVSVVVYTVVEGVEGAVVVGVLYQEPEVQLGRGRVSVQAPQYRLEEVPLPTVSLLVALGGRLLPPLFLRSPSPVPRAVTVGSVFTASCGKSFPYERSRTYRVTGTFYSSPSTTGPSDRDEILRSP